MGGLLISDFHFPSVQVPPVRACSDLYFQWHRKSVNAFHLFLHQLFHFALFLHRQFKQQFIVYLQNHPRRQLFFLQPFVNRNHCHLDQVRRRPLQWRIQCRALREIPQLHLWRNDLRNRPDSSEQRLRHSCLPCLCQHIIQVFLHSLVPCEIRVDELRRFFLLDSQLLRQAECRQSINDSEVDRFRRPPVFRRLRQRPHAKNFLCRPGVNVLAISERLHQHGIFRKMRHDPQFNLRVIRRQQYLPLLRHKRGANLSPQFASHRDILQIRIARAQPSRRCTRLRETRMQPLCLRMNQFRQRIHVRRFQLRNLAVFDHLPRQFMLLLISSRISAAFERTFPFPRRVGGCKFSLSKRISASCVGEFTLNSAPASFQISFSSRRTSFSMECDIFSSAFGSTRIPARSISASTPASGRSIFS